MSTQDWKNEKLPIYPKAVCAFCKSCTPDRGAKDRGELRYISEYLCKLHKNQRTINPITGKPTYAYYRIYPEWDPRDPEVVYTSEKYGSCCEHNEDGTCKDFQKINAKQEKEYKLATGEKDRR